MNPITSRERVRMALNHQEADRVPLDLASTSVTGMHVSTVYKLRQALGLDAPGTPVKVIDPFQMLGEIAPDLVERLGIDVLPLWGRGTFFGFRNEGWKPWTTFDGTPVLVPGDFNTEPDAQGNIVQYPQGDRMAAPSGIMPQGGFYFDAIMRDFNESGYEPRVEDNTEEFGLIPDAELEYLKGEAERLFTQTDKALMGSLPGAGYGDNAWLPAPFLKRPKGIRNYAEWFLYHRMNPDHIRRIYARQCEVALENLKRYFAAVGNRIDAIFISGADYAMQTGPLIDPETFRSLYLPFYKRVNDWIHEHTTWKIFLHNCGAVFSLIPLFIEAGFDILNPVQCSAAGMDPRELKKRFGHQLTFWGGGVDTQRTLPFGTPDEVRKEVRERISIFGPGGGFIYNSTHNIQPLEHVENLIALFETYQACCAYPID